MLARQQINAKFVREREEIASSMTVTFDKLGNELLNARHRHADHPLPFPLLELYCLVERTLER